MPTPRARRIVLLALAACGARTGIDDGAYVPEPTALTPRDAGTHDADATVSRDAMPPRVDSGLDAAIVDPCPAAVLARSPLPMLGNCSTRDGRSRVAGPKAPHVTWVTSLPSTLDNGSGPDLPELVAADGAGLVYFVSSTGTFTRLDGTTGALGWAGSFPGTPDNVFVLASGGVVALGIPSAPQEIVLGELEPATGQFTSRSFVSPPVEAGVGMPGTFNDLGTAPAIGADGSFYVAYSKNNGPQYFYPAVSRIRPDGSFVWSSTTVYPSGVNAPLPTVAPIAIGRDGVVLVAAGLGDEQQPTTSTVTGLDSETGAIVWNTPVDGWLVGGPAVAPDGTIAVVASVEDADLYVTIPVLYLLDGTGSVVHTVFLDSVPEPPTSTALYGIGLDGTILVGSDRLAAVSSAGDRLWTLPTPGPPDADFDICVPDCVLTGAFIDANDTVIVTYASGSASAGVASTLVGLDLATGATKWTLEPPTPPSGTGITSLGIGTTVLTSAGGLVSVAWAMSDDGPDAGPFSEYAPTAYAFFGASD